MYISVNIKICVNVETVPVSVDTLTLVVYDIMCITVMIQRFCSVMNVC